MYSQRAPAPTGSTGITIDTGRRGTVVLDCDGVVLQSNGLKTQMLRETLRDDPPDLVERFITYHQAHNGVTRELKLRHYYSEIYPSRDPGARAAAAVDRYSSLVRPGLKSCPEVPGVTRFLERISGMHHVFLISGGEQDEVREVFRDRGLDRYFEAILGGPRSKHEHLRDLADSGRVPDPRWYFGDSAVDLEVATEFGFRFTFIAGFSEWRDGRARCMKQGVPVLEDFTSPLLADIRMPSNLWPAGGTTFS